MFFQTVTTFVRLLVGLIGFNFSTLETFSLGRRLYQYRLRAANLDHTGHWSIDHEQWGFLNVPHLLWHGIFVYIRHLRGPMTLRPVAERLAVEWSLLRPRSLLAWIWTQNSCTLGELYVRKPFDTMYLISNNLWKDNNNFLLFWVTVISGGQFFSFSPYCCFTSFRRKFSKFDGQMFTCICFQQGDGYENGNKGRVSTNK